MKIHFEDVGRQKKTWTVELTEAELTEKRVLREIRKSGADVTLFLDQLVAVNDHDASVSATDDSGGLELGKNL